MIHIIRTRDGCERIIPPGQVPIVHRGERLISTSYIPGRKCSNCGAEKLHEFT